MFPEIFTSVLYKFPLSTRAAFLEFSRCANFPAKRSQLCCCLHPLTTCIEYIERNLCLIQSSITGNTVHYRQGNTRHVKFLALKVSCHYVALLLVASGPLFQPSESDVLIHCHSSHSKHNQLTSLDTCCKKYKGWWKRPEKKQTTPDWSYKFEWNQTFQTKQNYSKENHLKQTWWHQIIQTTYRTLSKATSMSASCSCQTYNLCTMY